MDLNSDLRQASLVGMTGRGEGPEGTDLFMIGGGGGRVGIISLSSSFSFELGRAICWQTFTHGPVLLVDILKNNNES